MERVAQESPHLLALHPQISQECVYIYDSNGTGKMQPGTGRKNKTCAGEVAFQQQQVGYCSHSSSCCRPHHIPEKLLPYTASDWELLPCLSYPPHLQQCLCQGQLLVPVGVLWQQQRL